MGAADRLGLLWGASPLPSIARFGRLVYPMHEEVTNRVLLGSKRHDCQVQNTLCEGRSDQSGKQTRGPERKGMSAAPKVSPMLKSLHGIGANRRPGHNVGKAEASWEETSKCTTRGAGVGDQARGERVAEVNVGKEPFPAGARSNLQGLSNQPIGEGGERIWVRHLSPYELRWPGNAGLGGGQRLPRRGNTPMGQRGPRLMTVLLKGHHARTCWAGAKWQTECRASHVVNSSARGGCGRALN